MSGLLQPRHWQDSKYELWSSTVKIQGVICINDKEKILPGNCQTILTLLLQHHKIFQLQRVTVNKQDMELVWNSSITLQFCEISSPTNNSIAVG